MDPLTQGVLGAALSLSASKARQLKVAAALGALSGMAPDLDVLISSSQDPLLFLEFHRQFTHSLLFIPIGSFICALFLHFIFAKRYGLNFRQSWFCCALGYGTHALLDACTSYGTQLLWPISDERFAWSIISVIDPLFTLPLLALVALAIWTHKLKFAHCAMSWLAIYLVFGLVQKERAEAVGWQLAEERKHVPKVLDVKPTLANLLVWKVVYEADDKYHVDAVRVGIEVDIFHGESTAKLDLARDFPWLTHDSQQFKDVSRFSRFSNGFLAQDPSNAERIIDVRYSMIPNEFSALWSIELSSLASSDAHVAYVVDRDNSPMARQKFVDMLMAR